MSDNSHETIRTLLASAKPDEVRQGLELVKQEVSRVGSNDARPLFEMVAAFFYVDPLDRPDLVPVLDEAVSLVVSFGAWVIPVLVEHLYAGDLKAQLAVGHALGRIGADAIGPLMTEYRANTDPMRQMFIMYALGKVKSPKIIHAVPLAIEAARSPDLELRDTATRALGRFVESIRPSDLLGTEREGIIESLEYNLADPNAGIRAKAVRSLGKLAKHGHLNGTELDKLRSLCRLILGIDDNFAWDRAYIVRKEAKEALTYT